MSIKENLPPPLSAGWEITYACNMSCKHCGSSCGKPLSDELTTKEALQLCDDLADLGLHEITLSGGEPLIRKDWFQIAKRLTDNNIITNIISNGWCIDNDVLDKAFEANISGFAISLDGLEKTHDYIRTKNSYKHVIRAIELMHKRKMPFSICTSINQLNLEELPKIKDILQRNQVYRWQLQLAMPMGNLLDHKQLILKPNDIHKIIDFGYDVIKEGIITIDLADCVGYYSIKDTEIRKKSDAEFGIDTIWQGCRAGKEVLGIKCNGDIIGCFSIRDNNFIEGNIRNTSIIEIWNDPNAFAWNRKFTKKDLKGFCNKCQYGSYCLGGCTVCKLTFSNSNYENNYCTFKVSIETEKQKISNINNSKKLFIRAKEMIKEEDFQLADLYLSRALEVNPDNIDILDNLGFVNYFMENYELSKKYNEESLRINPNNAYAHKGLGLCLIELNEFKRGITELNKAIELADEKYLDPYLDLAISLNNIGQYNKALQILIKGRNKSKSFKERTNSFFKDLQHKTKNH